MKYKIFHENKMYQANEHDPMWVIQMSGIVGKFNGNTYDTVKDAKVILFTGLKDKNGKEIYEGDIMKVHGMKRTGVYITDVIYDAPQFKLRINKTYFHDYAALNKGEVIGNIYENPELLSPQ